MPIARHLAKITLRASKPPAPNRSARENQIGLIVTEFNNSTTRAVSPRLANQTELRTTEEAGEQRRVSITSSNTSYEIQARVIEADGASAV
jgi:hypothetical protein